MGVFRFRQFCIDDSGCGMKICSDSVLLAAWFLPPFAENARSIIDVGAGSGVLSLLGAGVCPSAMVSGLEIDADAAACCRRNFESSPWSDRLTAVCTDFADYTPEVAPDIIISNPPYFTTGATATDGARATARHQQGLTYASLLHKAALWLGENGHLGMVSPADFEHEIIAEAEFSGLKLRRLLRVRTSAKKAPTRLLWDFGRTDGSLCDHTLLMRDSSGNITNEYHRMVSPYYLKV